jgi:hypothetical protein
MKNLKQNMVSTVPIAAGGAVPEGQYCRCPYCDTRQSCVASAPQRSGAKASTGPRGSTILSSSRACRSGVPRGETVEVFTAYIPLASADRWLGAG